MEDFEDSLVGKVSFSFSLYYFRLALRVEPLQHTTCIRLSLARQIDIRCIYGRYELTFLERIRRSA